MKSLFFALPTLLLLTTPAWARPAALDAVDRRVEEIRHAGSVPIIVADLDETLIDSTARRTYSYGDAVRVLCGENRSGDCGHAAGLNLTEVFALPNHYDLHPLFARVGITDAGWIKRLDDTAFNIYLSGKWLELDQPTPGAAEYVQRLRAAGATIFFVTARWQKSQGPGTLASLKHLGMATDADSDFVILRPEGLSSLEFKRRSFATINEWASAHGGVIAGSFENEPENMNAMIDAFPGSERVFVRGAFIKDEPLKLEVPTIVDFR